MPRSGAPERGGGIFASHSVRDDVDRELRAHLALRVDELVGAGWTPEEAEAEALRLLGDREEIAKSCVDIVKRHQRAVRRARTMDAILQDLRFGVRSAMRSPGFAIVALLTLALGIGANSAIFSVVQGVLLQPLPFPDSDELVYVAETNQRGGPMAVAHANFLDWEAAGQPFTGLFAYGSGSSTILGGEEPVIGTLTRTSHGIWGTLGVVPGAGRLTDAADHVEGAAPVVVVSRSFWENELAGRSLDDIVLQVNGFSAAVVGVVDDRDAFPAGTDVWQPLELVSQSTSRSAHNFAVVGRLGPDVPVGRAEVELSEVTRRLVELAAGEDPAYLATGVSVTPLLSQIVGDSRGPLLMLLGAAGLVLLVACTNLASTLLARGTNRARELAVRASLGADQGRLARQLLTEGVVLASGGALLGVGLAGVLLGALQRVGPASIPRLDEVGVDGVVLVYTLGLTAITVVLFGLFPALRLSRGGEARALRTGTRGNAGGSSGLVWTVLVGGEVALALVLLVGSGLLIRSLQALLAEDIGVDTSDVLVSPVALSRTEYVAEDQHADWYREAIAEIEARPGVSAAGVMSVLPLSGFLPNGRMELDGDLDARADGGYVVVSGHVFDALDVPLLEGRTFDDRDTPDQPHVAIVSESFAREYWPGGSPIGRSVTGGGMDNFYADRTFAQVVGVVGDVRYRSLGREPIPTVYFPYSQRPFRIQYGATIVAEATGRDPGAVAAPVRSVISTLESDVPLRVSTLDEVVGDSVGARRFTMLLLTGFSILALALAVVGIYGVVSYTVARRTREMGIRVALGARPNAVLSLVMRSSMRMVVVGLVLGVVVTLATAEVMRGLLYEVAPLDPVALVVAIFTLAAAAVLATWIPARRGTRVDPMSTMRAE